MLIAPGVNKSVIKNSSRSWAVLKFLTFSGCEGYRICIIFLPAFFCKGKAMTCPETTKVQSNKAGHARRYQRHTKSGCRPNPMSDDNGCFAYAMRYDAGTKL